VLTVVAFDALAKLIANNAGDRDAGITAFLALNNGEGWMLPEALRLADYGLGHDDRADAAQPVASRLGPRFLDWQLAQSPDESWAECDRHARAVLGDDEFARRFLGNAVMNSSEQGCGPGLQPSGDATAARAPQLPLFDSGHPTEPQFQNSDERKPSRKDARKRG